MENAQTDNSAACGQSRSTVGLERWRFRYTIDNFGPEKLESGKKRCENDGCASTFWSSLKAIRPQWIAENKLRYLFQYGYAPDPELPDVPFALDLLKGRTDDAKLLELASAPLSLGRPFAAPPGVPEERLAILRKSLMATFADPEFIAECSKQGIDCSTPTSGDDLQKIVNDAYAAPKGTIERLRKVYASQM